MKSFLRGFLSRFNKFLLECFGDFNLDSSSPPIGRSGELSVSAVRSPSRGLIIKSDGCWLTSLGVIEWLCGSAEEEVMVVVEDFRFLGEDNEAAPTNSRYLLPTVSDPAVDLVRCVVPAAAAAVVLLDSSPGNWDIFIRLGCSNSISSASCLRCKFDCKCFSNIFSDANCRLHTEHQYVARGWLWLSGGTRGG